MAEPTLESIVRDGLCSGCGACVYATPDGAVSMAMQSNGFLRPMASRPLAPVEQRAIRQVCPGIGLSHAVSDQGRVEYTPEWGPIMDMMAGHATDEEVRHKASSGGALSALLIHLLESGKVDFVVHTRASATQPLLNQATFSTNRVEVLTGAGSRYAPAAPVAALREALARQGKFAFVGKPCDVAAVRKIINADPALADRIPYLLSFMCAGTPSIEGTRQILKQFDMQQDDVVSFRYRGDGWPGLARAQARDGHVATMDYNTAWGQILNKFLQPRCKMCADGTGEFADVVCADAWYGKDGYPDFEEQAGRSLLIARNSCGRDLISAAIKRNSISTESFQVAALNVIQPYQKRRKQELLLRFLALKLLGKPIPHYKNFKLTSCSRKLSMRDAAKAFVGTLTRAIRGRV
jgi:coenzyme F420 hydrogenase subunit beta